LFNVYIDDLMCRLAKERLGCAIGDVNYGAIFYAVGCFCS